jgi:hypothetical protein
VIAISGSVPPSFFFLGSTRIGEQTKRCRATAIYVADPRHREAVNEKAINEEDMHCERGSMPDKEDEDSHYLSICSRLVCTGQDKP